MSETNGTYFKYLNQIFKEFVQNYIEINQNKSLIILDFNNPKKNFNETSNSLNFNIFINQVQQRFGSSFDLYENQQPFIGTAPNTNEININENNFFNKHNHLLLFLNTTRSGSAHRHFGITFKQFIGTIFLSFLFSGSQIILFSFLRTKFKTLYQPNLFLKKLKETLNKKKREKRNNKSSTIETTTTTTTTTTSSTTPNTINNSSNFSANSTKKKKKNEQVSDNNIYNMIISEDVNHGLFNWLKKSIFDVNHQDYFLLGLDAYLFIRFITMLSFFCFILTIVIVPILIPIHYNSGFNKKKTVTKLLNEQLGISNKTFITKNLLNNTHIHEEFIINYNGLDKISMSNIAPIYSNRLIYHFLLAVFTVLLFHFFLIHELNFYCKSKANFSKMLEENKNVNFFKELWDSRATLFVDNVPSSMLKNMELLIYFFEKFCPCSVTDIWFIPKNYERFFKFKKRHIKILNKIEKIEMELLLNNYFLLNFNEDLKPLLLSSLSGNSSSYNNDNGNSTSNYLISQYKNNLLLENTVSYEHLRFIKNAKIHTFMNFFKMNNLVEVEFKKITFKLKFLKTPLQITLYKPIVNYRYKTYSKNKNTLLDNCVYSYIENLQKWGNFKEIILDKSQPAKPNKGKNKCKVPLVANYNYDFKSFHKKAFIKFKSIYMADIYHQLLLSDHINLLNNKIVGTNLKDIIWDNLTCSSSTLLFIRNLIGNLCTFAVIIGWVVPVAFVGLTSQIPYLTKLVPFLSIINTFPPLITELLENIIPVLTLMFLTEIVPDIFRWLSWLKGGKTQSAIELDTQKCFYFFLFVHVFLVVTISSGISVMIEKLIRSPVSIPHLLANNLPKCSNFFCSFVIIRGLSYFSANLLRSKELLKTIFYYPLVDITPRKKFERLTNLPTYKWGSIYPMFSMLASISIIYSVIAPIILPLSLLAFLLVLISFRYSIKYQYSLRNHSESFGLFYPTALFQMYSGIYCLEICLLGLFLLSSSFKLSISMVLFLIFTGICHYQIQSNFNNLLSNTSITFYHPRVQVSQKEPTVGSDIQDLIMKPKIFPEFLQTGLNDFIWLPKDYKGFTNEQIKKLKSNYGSNIKVSTAHYKLNLSGDIIML